MKTKTLFAQIISSKYKEENMFVSIFNQFWEKAILLVNKLALCSDNSVLCFVSMYKIQVSVFLQKNFDILHLQLSSIYQNSVKLEIHNIFYVFDGMTDKNKSLRIFKKIFSSLKMCEIRNFN